MSTVNVLAVWGDSAVGSCSPYGGFLLVGLGRTIRVVNIKIAALGF